MKLVGLENIYETYQKMMATFWNQNYMILELGIIKNEFQAAKNVTNVSFIFDVWKIV